MSRRTATAVNIWRQMPPPALRRLALAVFFLFGVVGLVPVLMESSIKVYSWSFIAVQTIASGGMAASIILFGRRRWYMVLLIVAVWNAVLIWNGSGLSFVFSANEGMRVRLSGVQDERRRPLEEEIRTLTQEKLDAVYVQRGIVGGLALAFLTAGYVLFLGVIRREVGRRTQFETEVRIAREIQQSLLPAPAADLGCCSVAGLTIPAGEVGGDYHDFLELSDGRVAVAIADVTGHGVGAGILSAMTKSAFHTQVGHDAEPIPVLRELNRVVYDLSDSKTFVTFAYALIDPVHRTVQVVTAGHPPVLCRRSGGEVTVLRSKNPALGMRRGVEFGPGESVAIGPGDIFLLYTDGLLEASRKGEEQFGEARVRATLVEEAASPAELLERVLASLERFAGKREGFEDDISLVSIIMR